MELIPLNPDLALFALRLALGVLFLAHGPLKIVKAREIASSMNLHPNMAASVGVMETLGALSLLLGIMTQAGALLISAIMLGAIYLKTQKWDKDFTGPNGWQLEFIILAAALTVLLAGAGEFTVV